MEVLYGSPLYIEMLTGAKIIYDEDNFFSNYSKKLNNKLKKLKSIKKNGYWIYKEKVNKNIMNIDLAKSYLIKSKNKVESLTCFIRRRGIF